MISQDTNLMDVSNARYKWKGEELLVVAIAKGRERLITIMIGVTNKEWMN